MELSEKEFAVMRIIHHEYMPDQRAIAVRAGISLGMANLLIHRLMKRGIIKARQINSKKIHYFLTAKGFSEKASKSYLFTQKTIKLIKSIKQRLMTLLMERQANGVSSFVLTGNNEELIDIFIMLHHNMPHLSLCCNRCESQNKDRTLSLSFKEPNTGKLVEIDVMEYLSSTGEYWQ